MKQGRNEEQQMVADSNAQGVHHYVYDYRGERIMKSSFVVTQTWQDDDLLSSTATLEAYTVYANPYLVSSYFDNGSTIENRSTQHYYMGMQRVASGQFAKPVQSTEPPGGGEMKTTSTQDGKVVLDQLEDILQTFGYETGTDYTRAELEQPVSLAEAYRSAAEIPLDALASSRDPEYSSQKDSLTETMSLLGPGELCTGIETEVYWYHPNYLGSVDLVTDKDGLVHQFFLYTPWGESMYTHNAQTQGFDSPYRFNAKELDPETGLAYYGARYYQNRLSIWLSVDPFSSEAPHLTPYHFVSNNPVMRIDPDGMNDYIAGADGTVTVLETNATSHSFYYLDGEGALHEIGTWDKSESGLVQPDNIAYEKGDVSINISIKETSRDAGTAYFSGEALASLIGASAESGGEEIFVTRASESDGSSPGDSQSHTDGKNFDMRFVTADGSRRRIDYSTNPEDFESISLERSATLNSALNKFGYKDIRASSFVERIPYSPIQIPGTRHLPNHSDHQHLQGYRPQVSRYDIRPLPDIMSKSFKSVL